METRKGKGGAFKKRKPGENLVTRFRGVIIWIRI